MRPVPEWPCAVISGVGGPSLPRATPA